MQDTTKQSLIYIIHAEGTGFVKIGTSREPERRLGEIQTGCPHVCRIVHTVPGTREIESGVHRRLAPNRAAGEWFLFTDKTIQEIISTVDEAINAESSYPISEVTSAILDAWLSQVQSLLTEIKSRGASVRIFQRSDGLAFLLANVHQCPTHRIIHSGATCPICQ